VNRLLSLPAVFALVLMGGVALLVSFPSFALAPAAVASPASTRYALTGRVVGISDGDTFNILVNGRQQRVRMASIDAPEIGRDRERPGQPHSQASRDALAKLIAGRTLTLDCHERDRYERNVCDVPLEGSMTANQRQVASGMAWANMEGRGKFMRDRALPSLQERARDARLGLWEQARPVPPCVWRYQCWKKQQC